MDFYAHTAWLHANIAKDLHRMQSALIDLNRIIEKSGAFMSREHPVLKNKEICEAKIEHYSAALDLLTLMHNNQTLSAREFYYLKDEIPVQAVRDFMNIQADNISCRRNSFSL